MDNLTQWTVESALLHSDKANKRLFIVIVILLVALLGTNAGWIYYESQWAVVNSTEVPLDEPGRYHHKRLPERSYKSGNQFLAEQRNKRLW